VEKSSWTPEAQLKVMDRLERMETVLTEIFKTPVRITNIDWNPKEEPRVPIDPALLEED